jgi:hypothetical protein
MRRPAYSPRRSARAGDRDPDAPIHTVADGEEILTVFPLGTMQEGDAFIMNDPYAGGTHIPDIAVVMPVFEGGLRSASARRSRITRMSAACRPAQRPQMQPISFRKASGFRR